MTSICCLLNLLHSSTLIPSLRQHWVSQLILKNTPFLMSVKDGLLKTKMYHLLFFTLQSPQQGSVNQWERTFIRFLKQGSSEWSNSSPSFSVQQTIIKSWCLILHKSSSIHLYFQLHFLDWTLVNSQVDQSQFLFPGLLMSTIPTSTHPILS